MWFGAKLDIVPNIDKFKIYFNKRKDEVIHCANMANDDANKNKLKTLLRRRIRLWRKKSKLKAQSCSLKLKSFDF
jgi:hypothetical protein